MLLCEPRHGDAESTGRGESGAAEREACTGPLRGRFPAIRERKVAFTWARALAYSGRVGRMTNAMASSSRACTSS